MSVAVPVEPDVTRSVAERAELMVREGLLTGRDAVLMQAAIAGDRENPSFF
jgi:hypothetical protein